MARRDAYVTCSLFMSHINIGLLGMAEGHMKGSPRPLPTRGAGRELQPYVRADPLRCSAASPLSAPLIHCTAEPKEFLWKGPPADRVLQSRAEVLGFSAQLGKHRIFQLKAAQKVKSQNLKCI